MTTHGQPCFPRHWSHITTRLQMRTPHQVQPRSHHRGKRQAREAKAEARPPPPVCPSWPQTATGTSRYQRPPLASASLYQRLPSPHSNWQCSPSKNLSTIRRIDSAQLSPRTEEHRRMRALQSIVRAACALSRPRARDQRVELSKAPFPARCTSRTSQSFPRHA